MNLFSFIKERISIINVVNEYVTLKKIGGYYKGTCPFHHEKTASFTVSPDKAIFYCFGCHVSGDVIGFIAKIENCSQKEAAQLLSERYHIELPQNITYSSSEKTAAEKQHYFAVCKAVTLWCQEQLQKNQAALLYFKKRGFSDAIISYFSLGYFPSGGASINNLLYAMQKESILAQDLVDANFLAQGRTTFYSPFEDRLMFPIQDALGRYCGFGGRIFKDHDTRAKYYNSRENDYFLKGSLLFNLDRAKKNIQETGSVILVEGYTDCMAMIQHGYINTVATLGTACTSEHLKIVARYASKLFVLYDNDHAGQQAILRLTEMCWHVNLELQVITLPPREDPASFLEKGGDLAALIHKAQDIFLFFIDSLGETFINKPLNQKLHITRGFLSTLISMNDPLKQDILLQKAANSFDIPFESLKAELSHMQKEKNLNAPKSIQKEIDNKSEDPSMLEKRIFCAIMNNMQLLHREGTQRLINYLPSPLQDIIIKIKNAQKDDSHLIFSRFFDMLEDHSRLYVSKLLLESDDKIDSDEFDALLVQLQKKQWKVIVHDIKSQLARAKQEGNSEKTSRILHEFMELQATIMPTNKAVSNVSDINGTKTMSGELLND